MDFKFGVGYGDDIQKVKQVLQKIADEHPLVMKEPAPMIVLGDMATMPLFFISEYGVRHRITGPYTLK